MSNYLGSKQPSVLILADFSDGSWHAVSFAMQFLYRHESSLSILQTYQQPNYGMFMMRNLTYQLKKITKYELKTLKNKLLMNYGIVKRDINTLSIEGDLNTILHNSPIISEPCYIVLGTYNSFEDSCNMQNMYLIDIIDSTENPLFILPGEFNGKVNKKLLYVGTTNKKPSKQLINQVVKICKETHSALDVLFVLNHGIAKIPDDVLSSYHENLQGIDYEINHRPNTSRCKGIKKYLKESSRDLIVIENIGARSNESINYYRDE